MLLHNFTINFTKFFSQNFWLNIFKKNFLKKNPLDLRRIFLRYFSNYNSAKNLTALSILVAGRLTRSFCSFVKYIIFVFGKSFFNNVLSDFVLTTITSGFNFKIYSAETAG